MAQKSITIFKLKNSTTSNSDNFYAIGELNQFESAILRRNYCGHGSFELWAPITAENRMFFTPPADHSRNFVYFGDNVAGFIEIVQSDVDTSGNLRYHISGRTCEALMLSRAFGLAGETSGGHSMIINTTTFNNLTAAQIITKMLHDCYSADWDGKTIRQIPYLVAPQFSANLPNTTFQFQRSGGSLYDAIVDFLSQEALSLGFWVKFDPANRRLIPYVYAGVDRSASQNENPTVVFSDQLNDILQSQYIFDISDYKNAAYVAGEGEGSDRVIVQTTRETQGFNYNYYDDLQYMQNFALYEYYVDARDVSRKYANTIEEGGTDENATLTDAEYYTVLARRGTSKLADFNVLNTFNATIRTQGNTMYKYGVDYNLGDIITIEDTRLGISTDTRITASEETFGANYSLNLTFGENPKTLTETLSRINNNFTN